ncbi:MAG: site-2 protease family protein [Bacteriovoracaceae bacterium]|nr:site-2 protease family protein [Bacteriovoracaceae bacterium]
MDAQNIIYNIALSAPGFLMAVVFHEAAHAYVAHRFGDDTAMRQGRMSLNPMVHIDMMGTVIFPLIGIIAGFMAIGWATPVPIESRNFKNFKSGMFWVSFAGPLSNILLGTFSSFLMVLLALHFSAFSYTQPVTQILSYSASINFLLAAFNLLPIPPLDGARMISSFLNYRQMKVYESFAQYTPYIFLFLMALSFMGVHLLGYLMQPVQGIGDLVTIIFFKLLGS